MGSIYGLIILWILGGAVICGLVVAQLAGGHYDNPIVVYSWAVASLGPGAGACAALWEANHRLRTQNQNGTPSGVLSFLFGLSIIQLVLMLVTLLIEPMAIYDPGKWLDVSQFWIAPLNGFIVAVVGRAAVP